jgi:lipopolysaccharide biosynthesis regulator YciM
LRAATVLLVTTISIVAHARVEDDLRDGDRFFESSEWAKAAGAFDRAIAKAPGQVPAAAYGKRAAIYIILEDYAGGLAFVARTKGRFPNAPEILEQEALLLWETDRREDAVKVAERTVAARPQAFTNQKLIGEYYASRDPAKTAAAYEGYLASRPADLEPGDVLPRARLGFAYLTLARGAISAGEPPKAKTLFTKAANQFETMQRRLGKRPNATVNAENGLCAAYTGLGRFDQAVTVCERIAADGKRIDATGSVWFNLATAYLARRQIKKARTAASEFAKLRKAEARGLILLGDTFFAERDWGKALDHFTRAEKLVKPNQAAEQVQLSIRLGKTYRRLPAPASGANPNVAIAIEKLTAALAANPTSTELALELGGAYLEAKQDAKATALTERMLTVSSTPADARAKLLVLAGKSLFNQRKLREARQRFEAAQQARPADVTIQRALVLTINEQAFEAGKDGKAAQALIDQALAVDPGSPVTTTNLAVLAIDRGDCDDARKHLVKLESIRGHDVVARTRLLARTYLCAARPDPKKAAETFAIAEREAKKANAGLALAEIYTEWAPLVWDSDLAGAVEKLELAVQASTSDAGVAGAAKRNLAIALFRRGWKSIRDGKPIEAAADFERATRDPNVLKGTEPLAFEFSYAIALLDANRSAEAAKLFKSLAGKGNQAAYLKPPYAKIGSQFFGAYAGYRSGTLAARQQAAADFARLEGEAQGGFRERVRELIASSWESVAAEQWRAGQGGAANRSLQQAEKYATGDLKRRLAMDRAVIALDRGDLAALEAMGGVPPESLVNLGIIYDQLGRPKDAYDAWTRARARGVQSRELSKWIDAKKRIYGF